MVPKLSQCCPKVVLQISWSYLKVILNMSQSWSIVVPKLVQSCPKAFWDIFEKDRLVIWSALFLLINLKSESLYHRIGYPFDTARYCFWKSAAAVHFGKVLKLIINGLLQTLTLGIKVPVFYLNLAGLSKV